MTDAVFRAGRGKTEPDSIWRRGNIMHARNGSVQIRHNFVHANKQNHTIRPVGERGNAVARSVYIDELPVKSDLRSSDKNLRKMPCDKMLYAPPAEFQRGPRALPAHFSERPADRIL